MSPRQIAERIPAEYRREILELNMIENAIAITTDPTMHQLCVYWKNYIDPSFSPDCNFCCATVLTNYKNLRNVFVEMENEEKLIDQV